MPRTVRALTGGIGCHGINRGNGRMKVFHGRDDYASFVGPFGTQAWTARIVRQLGLESTVRPPRPTKKGRQKVACPLFLAATLPAGTDEFGCTSQVIDCGAGRTTGNFADIAFNLPCP